MIRPRRFINLNTRVYAASVVQRDAPIRTFAMAPMKPIAADKITEPEFNDLLSHYPSLIKLIDTSKPGMLRHPSDVHQSCNFQAF